MKVKSITWSRGWFTIGAADNSAEQKRPSVKTGLDYNLSFSTYNSFYGIDYTYGKDYLKKWPKSSILYKHDSIICSFRSEVSTLSIILQNQQIHI